MFFDPEIIAFLVFVVISYTVKQQNQCSNHDLIYQYKPQQINQQLNRLRITDLCVYQVNVKDHHH